MSLILVEGSRRSGKSYLISQQNHLPVFKFDFNTNFSTWNFDKNTQDIHWFGLGKEIMLHELNLSGFIPDLVVDRGILTNSVWGVFQGRVSEEHARQDLINANSRGLFKNTKIVLIEAENPPSREKDIWDQDDSRIKEEKDLFTSFSLLLQSFGVDAHVFHNKFDLDSVEAFKKEILDICAEY